MTDYQLSDTTGTLLLSLSSGKHHLPGAGFEITLTAGSKTERAYTDKKGKAEFTVSTPRRIYSQSFTACENGNCPFASVSLEIKKTGYVGMTLINLPVFPETESLISENMKPLEPGENPNANETFIFENHLLYTNANPQNFQDAVTVAAEPKPGKEIRKTAIPEFITVHLGPPDSDAEDITVPYIYYLKNVASNEIYPTWPEQSLKANITAQNTLALNRIYTEWYKSQGYPFQITSSTAFDQKFVKGSVIFDTVSKVADEIFQEYITRFGDSAPIFSEYCDGKTVQCAGMSQWGTVKLAREGKSSVDILRNYYGNDILIKIAPTVSILPDSYPGVLSEGDESDDVRAMQIRLNRIAINYPEIPFIRKFDGIYDSGTVNSVKAFQKIFSLPVTGVTDSDTWYKIIYIYTAVTKLAELSGEGDRPTSDNYPGKPLKKGSRGVDVLRMQYYLRVIAQTDERIPAPLITGTFGAMTENSVYNFQKLSSLTPDGIIGEQTWNKITAAYRYIEENSSVPEPYPGKVFSRGSRGSSVLYIQKAINEISKYVPELGKLDEDGVFGPATEKSVKAFQSFYGLDVDGKVGKLTWDKLAEEYETALKISGIANGN